MTDYYCTGAEVRNKTIDNHIKQAEWNADNTEVNVRIVEAQNLIDAQLGNVFTVPFSKGSSTPPLINTCCKWLSRALILRDIIEEQVVESEDGIRILANKWKKDAQEIIDGLLGNIEGKAPLILLNTSGVAITRATTRTINSSTQNVGRIFTMDNEIDQSVDESLSESPVVEEE